MDHHHIQGHHDRYSSNYAATTGGDRFPQWSIQETRDLLMIRADLDPNFMENKHNKILWELVSTRMKEEKGFARSAEQCKGKWKNLVTRFKGCETMVTEAMKQQSFPFYNEVKVIFAARMQRILWLEVEAGGAAASYSKKNVALLFSSEEEDDILKEDSEHDKSGVPKKKRKIKGNNRNPPSGINTNTQSKNMINGIKEIMEDFMNKQIQMETLWLKAYEEREKERRVREMEWRQTMEGLENERLMMDKRWREREHQWKIREEARAEKRDALITALLNKLRREDM
ncbi:trihelix transcription factor GT-3b-like [Primulina tabacum]|uniref:trihelix transcription factor GT-3b-like n=1 Tax=Primulina tabacum TaxID=48773 RepID=UPI003F5A8A5F